MADETLPPGWHKNSQDQQEAIAQAASAALRAAQGRIIGLAIIAVFPDLTTSCSLGFEADLEKASLAFAKLKLHGGDVLRATMERALQGKGTTLLSTSDKPKG